MGNQSIEPAVLQLALEIHNDLRRKHGSPPMTLDPKLCAEAHTYAKAVVSGNRFPAPGTPGVGRNVLQVYGGVPRSQATREAMVREVIGKWYDHIKEYNWGLPTISPPTANIFSQIIWANSTQLGFSMATQDNATVVVAIYYPGPNFINAESYKDNVQQADK